MHASSTICTTLHLILYTETLYPVCIFLLQNMQVPWVEPATCPKPFVCDTCGTRVSSRKTLLCHMRMHQGIYKYKCPRCDKGMSSSAMLRSHMALHTGVKEFRCEICSKEFTAKQSLKSHTVAVHGRMPLM